jgi:hypothetical protein
VITLLPGRPEVQITAGARHFSPLQKVQTCSGAHPASCSVGSEGFIIQGYSGWDVITTHHHLALKLRIRGAIHLCFPYTPSWREDGQVCLLPYPHGGVPYVTFVFSVSLQTTRRRQDGLCTLPVKHHYIFYSSFAVVVQRLVPDLPGSWRMCMFVDGLSACDTWPRVTATSCAKPQTSVAGSPSVCVPRHCSTDLCMAR